MHLLYDFLHENSTNKKCYRKWKNSLISKFLATLITLKILLISAKSLMPEDSMSPSGSGSGTYALLHWFKPTRHHNSSQADPCEAWAKPAASCSPCSHVCRACHQPLTTLVKKSLEVQLKPWMMSPSLGQMGWEGGRSSQEAAEQVEMGLQPVGNRLGVLTVFTWIW